MRRSHLHTFQAGWLAGAGFVGGGWLGPWWAGVGLGVLSAAALFVAWWWAARVEGE